MLDVAGLGAALSVIGAPYAGCGLVTARSTTDAGPTTYYPITGGYVRVCWSAAPTTQQDTQAAAIVAAYVPQVPAPIYTIAAAIAALNSTQWANIVANFFSGNPALWQRATGPNSYAMGLAAISFIQANGAIVFGNKFQQVDMVASYVAAINTQYLVNPSWDPTINVPGTQAAS